MGMVVKNNLSANNTLNKLNANNSELAKSLKKVSSGMRINGAGDDASGYSIGTKMEVMVRALGQDIDNTKTGRNLVKTAEGGIQEIINNIREMKEMALNSANAHNSDVDREIIQKDFTSHMRTIADIAATTNYDGRLLLNGDYREPYSVTRAASVRPIVSGSVEENTLEGLCSAFSAGTDTSEAPGRGSGATGGLECDKTYDGTAGTDTSSYESMKKMTVNIDFSGATKDGASAVYPDDYDGQGFVILCSACDQYINIKFDSSKTVPESTYNPEISTSPWAREYVIGIADVTSETELEEALFEGIKVAKEGYDLEALYTGSDARRRGDYLGIDPDYYKKSAMDHDDDISVDPEHNMRIVKNADGSISFTRFVDGTRLCIYDKGTYSDDSDPDPDPYEKDSYLGNPLIIHTGPKANQHLRVYINSMHPIAMGLNRAAVNPWERAVESLAIIDRALEYALNENTRMGAYQVRLNETEDNLVTAEENTTSSMSKIRDADMAKEMATYTKNNVLTQSAQSMLSQANQNVGGVLDLLQ